MQKLGDYWNKLGNRRLVIINTHGWPNALANRQGMFSSPGASSNNSIAEFVTFRSSGNELFDKVNKEWKINRGSNYGWILYKTFRTTGKNRE